MTGLEFDVRWPPFSADFVFEDETCNPPNTSKKSQNLKLYFKVGFYNTNDYKLCYQLKFQTRNKHG